MQTETPPSIRISSTLISPVKQTSTHYHLHASRCTVVFPFPGTFLLENKHSFLLHRRNLIKKYARTHPKLRTKTTTTLVTNKFFQKNTTSPQTLQPPFVDPPPPQKKEKHQVLIVFSFTLVVCTSSYFAYMCARDFNLCIRNFDPRLAKVN